MMPKTPNLASEEKTMEKIYCQNDAKNAMRPDGKNNGSCGFAD